MGRVTTTRYYYCLEPTVLQRRTQPRGSVRTTLCLHTAHAGARLCPRQPLFYLFYCRPCAAAVVDLPVCGTSLGVCPVFLSSFFVHVFCPVFFVQFFLSSFFCPVFLSTRLFKYFYRAVCKMCARAHGVVNASCARLTILSFIDFFSWNQSSQNIWQVLPGLPLVHYNYCIFSSMLLLYLFYSSNIALFGRVPIASRDGQAIVLEPCSLF
jgi:hypothetical protein